MRPAMLTGVLVLATASGWAQGGGQGTAQGGGQGTAQGSRAGGRQEAGGVAAGGPISRGVIVLPETVTVGDPFRVVVRVRAPRGTTIAFPLGPDSGTGVEALDPVDVVPSSDTTVTEHTATYRLAAWDVGARSIRIPDIVLRDSTTGADGRRVEVGRRLSVFVTSVLPADSAERVPKPARALFEFGPPWWWWALVAALAFGVVGTLWWLWRRRRRAAAVRPSQSPREQAEEEFGRIEALELVASGERGQHAALMIDVLRTYLARIVPAALPSLTTTELLGRLRGDARVPAARLARLLHDVDLVKFAGAPIEAERATEAGTESRAIVAAVDAAVEAALVRAREQALRRTDTREAA
ncbi:MAG: hypothetical protein IPF98_14055 [Gemmatimonadetes bacterium]|nr:hypothetical protein [Gemmatimonadota bacterium]